MARNEYSDFPAEFDLGLGEQAEPLEPVFIPCEGYATAPIEQAYDWRAVLDYGIEQGRMPFGIYQYGFAFRSNRDTGAYDAELNILDPIIESQAKDVDGFIQYLPGEQDADGNCLSICLWASPEAAMRVAFTHAHKEAKGLAPTAYNSVDIEHFAIMRNHSAQGFDIKRLGSPHEFSPVWGSRGNT